MEPVIPARHAPAHGWRPFIFAAAGATLLVVAGVAGWWPHHRNEQKLEEGARREKSRVPQVPVSAARSAPTTESLHLPGNITAVIDVPIQSRADGFISRRLVDIGDRVDAGQLMAELETPELDAQVRQGSAAVAQARSTLAQTHAGLVRDQASERLAQLTAVRYHALMLRGAVSKQDSDDRVADAQVKAAIVVADGAVIKAAEEAVAQAVANLQRLRELRGFKQLRAPFEGLVTARNVDVGSLISTGAAGRELFRVAQIDLLRIIMDVPQTVAAALRPGSDAAVTVGEYPRRTFHGTLTRTARALNTASRTMQAEVQVANLDHALLPGMYAQVQFTVAQPAARLLVPGSAVLSDASGTRVAVLERGRVRLHEVTLGRDLGTQTEVLAGLEAGESVVTAPDDRIQDGVRADPAPQASPRAAASPAPQAAASPADASPAPQPSPN